MIKLTQSELIEIPFSKFLKLELPRFALRVIEIVDSYKPEELKIKEMFDLLVAETPRIDKLKDKYGPHPLTEELSKLREMRSLYISTLRFDLKKAIKEEKSGNNSNLNLVRIELNHFFDNLDLSTNEEMYNQKVTQFFGELDRSEELENAFSLLDFNKALDELRSVHSNIQNQIGAKLRSVSKRKGETTAELKKAVLKPITLLFKQMDIAPFMNPELDYTSLFNELNQLTTDYINMINRRVLFNKKNAEKLGDENGESTETMTTTQSKESAGRMMMPLEMEDVGMKGLEIEPDEMEKTAAMSSITMQLPLDNENEA